MTRRFYALVGEKFEEFDELPYRTYFMYGQNGKEYIGNAMLVYTRLDDASFGERLRGKPTAVQQELISQKAMVERFISEHFQDQTTGCNLRAYHRFDRPVTFSQRLREHLGGVSPAGFGGSRRDQGSIASASSSWLRRLLGVPTG